jgi:hypothetical protein
MENLHYKQNLLYSNYKNLKSPKKILGEKKSESAGRANFINENSVQRKENANHR